MAIRKLGEPNKLYNSKKDQWKKIDDICDGENLEGYIVKINPSDESEPNKIRNQQYFKRAVFYRIAGYTCNGLIGLPFQKNPSLKIPAGLEYIKENIDGSGVSIYQQSQKVLKNLTRKARGGLLVEYPITQGPASKADLDNLKIFSTIQFFEALQIIHWEVIQDGAKVKLSRLELLAGYEENVDKTEEYEVLRLLKLEDIGTGVLCYVSYKYLKINGEWVEQYRQIPKNGSGKYWNEIPFVFLGSETNTRDIQEPPMNALVDINIGHFNNSAEYEDIVYQVGQPQAWMSGLDDTDYKELKDDKFYIGCGRMLRVPMNGQFGIAQMQYSPASREAMKDKVEMAVGLGAMFVQPGSAVKTATQSEGEQQVQHSILSLIVSNINEAYTKCLKWMCQYMAISITADILYAINQDFIKVNADAQTITAMVASWMQGALPLTDLIKWFQKRNIIDPEKDPEKVKEELEQSPAMPNLNADVNSNTGGV